MMEAKVMISKLFHTTQIYDPFPEERVLEKLVTMSAKPKKGVFIGVVNWKESSLKKQCALAEVIFEYTEFRTDDWCVS